MPLGVLTGFLPVVGLFFPSILANGEAAATEPRVLRTLWEKDLPGGIPEGYEEHGELDRIEEITDEAAFVKAVLGSREYRKLEVIRIQMVEIKGKQYCRVRWLHNRKAEEEQGKVLIAATQRLLLTEDIGPYKNVDPNPKGSAGRGSGYIFFDRKYDSFDARITFRHESASPHVDQAQINVGVTECLESPIPDHDFLRYSIRHHPHLVSLDGNWLIHSIENGFAELSWKSGNHHSVWVTGGGKAGSETVARKYLEKYPSSLSRDFKIDKEQWGRREVEVWLGRMKRTLDDWDRIKDDIVQDSRIVKEQDVYHSINACVDWLASFGVEVPLGKNCNQSGELDFEQSKRVYDYLCAWWKEYGHTAYWDVRYQCLRTHYPRAKNAPQAPP